MVDPRIQIRPLTEAEWPAAQDLLTRAYCDEPYLHHLFPDDPLRRFEFLSESYHHTPFDPAMLHVGAWIGQTLVALAGCCRVGQCDACNDPALEIPPQPGVEEPKTRKWERAVYAQHRGHGPHGRLGPVAVDPSVRHLGIGSAVVAEVIRRFDAEGGGTVMLECRPWLVGFYGAHGWREVGTFVDPAGPPDMTLMRRD